MPELEVHNYARLAVEAIEDNADDPFNLKLRHAHMYDERSAYYRPYNWVCIQKPRPGREPTVRTTNAAIILDRLFADRQVSECPNLDEFSHTSWLTGTSDYVSVRILTEEGYNRRVRGEELHEDHVTDEFKLLCYFRAALQKYPLLDEFKEAELATSLRVYYLSGELGYPEGWCEDMIRYILADVPYDMVLESTEVSVWTEATVRDALIEHMMEILSEEGLYEWFGEYGEDFDNETITEFIDDLLGVSVPSNITDPFDSGWDVDFVEGYAHQWAARYAWEAMQNVFHSTYTPLRETLTTLRDMTEEVPGPYIVMVATPAHLNPSSAQEHTGACVAIRGREYIHPGAVEGLMKMLMEHIKSAGDADPNDDPDFG